MVEQKTAVGYIRTSTGDQSLSVDAQLHTIEEYCRRNDLLIVALFQEEGVSGGASLEERTMLLDAVNELGSQGADFLVVAKRDRLARDIMVSAMVERLVVSNGGKIVSCDGVTSEDTPEGRMLRQMLDVFSEYERQLIKSRTKAALRQKKVRGEKLGGRPPFGWRKDYLGKLVVDEAAQHVIRVIQALKRRMTYDQVVRHLAAEGYCNHDGKPFSRSTVVRICKQDYKSIGE